MAVTIRPAYDEPEILRELFSAYTQMLVEANPIFQEYLSLQNYDEELNNVEEKYGMPQGRLYLAYWEEAAVGCIALRKIDAERCELKRLYVQPEFRNQGIGTLLINKVIEEARVIGYTSMLLDTLPFLESAQRLYEKHGFVRVEKYNESPMDDSIFMKLEL